MDLVHSVSDFIFILIAFLAGAYAERRRTGGRCANTSTNSQSDAIAALADKLMVARTNGLTGQQVNLLIVELRQLTHV